MGTYFDKCIGKLKDVDTPDKQHGLMDLALTELPYVDKKRLKQLFIFVSNNLEVSLHLPGPNNFVSSCIGL